MIKGLLALVLMWATVMVILWLYFHYREQERERKFLERQRLDELIYGEDDE